MSSLKKVVLAALKSGKQLTNSQIAKFVANNRIKYTPRESIDNGLAMYAKNGLIQRESAIGKGLGRSKYVYSIPKTPTVSSIVLATVIEQSGKDKLDSLNIYLAVKSVLPNAKKSTSDAALIYHCGKGSISRSKDPMTDVNAISNASKFLYFKTA